MIDNYIKTVTKCNFFVQN